MPVYDMLERVQDAKVERRKISSSEGWLSELKESEVDETDEIDLHGITSSL